VWRVFYTLYATVVVLAASVVMYADDSRSNLSGTGYRGGGSGGYSGGSGHK
jgi:hypothetical protein